MFVSSSDVIPNRAAASFKGRSLLAMRFSELVGPRIGARTALSSSGCANSLRRRRTVDGSVYSGSSYRLFQLALFEQRANFTRQRAGGVEFGHLQVPANVANALERDFTARAIDLIHPH